MARRKRDSGGETAARAPVEQATAPGSALAGDAAPIPDPTAVFARLGLPPSVVDGKPNHEFYRQAHGKLLALLFDAISKDGRVPFNLDAASLMLDRMAKVAGIDPKTVHDQRSKEQVAADAFERVLSAPSEWWELTAEEIDAVGEVIQQRMDAADRGAIDYIEGRIRDAPGAGGGGGPKVWRSRLELLRRLRERASKPIPRYGISDRGQDRAGGGVCARLKPMYEAAWPLRVMVYAGRSNMAHLANAEPSRSVYMVGAHHVKMVCDYWEARHGVAYMADPKHPAGRDAPIEIVRGMIDYKGCVIVAPMGHGKTDTGRFLTACEIALNPHTQAILLHAAAEKARENLAYLASLFAHSTPVGRRFFSLFGLSLDAVNANLFRVALPDRNKSPTAMATGVKGKGLGGNASFQWWDDPVPMSDREQETERKRTFSLLHGTWMTRMRGREGWFLLVTATLWHNDDAIAKTIQLVRDEKAKYRVSIQRCGGPRTFPKFAPLWPEVYPASELETRYNSMKDPSLYSAAYMSNPVADERRIVQEMRYYDKMLVDSVGLPTEHAHFCENCVKYISLDPSATRGERADLAGIVYAGLGSVGVRKLVDGHWVHATEKRLRLFDYEAIPATQSDLVQHTVSLCRQRPVDFVLVETRSGFHATADMFENYHGIDVIRLDPKCKSKEERLRAAAPALEHKNADIAGGGFRAVVEFPGVRTGRFAEDGSPVLALDPRFRQLADEILDFGVCGSDHGLDALTQMVIYLAPDLAIGTGGTVSKKAVEQHRRHSDPRLEALLKEWAGTKDGAKNNKCQEATENTWLAQTWAMPARDGPGGWVGEAA